ncbi:hypothetical protein PIB30_062779 [Stylosanthes scabra]|uniref:Myb/SANT-like domain-containing protein n=1 Tax=Stylosanthes scabra TaxID=79078 RepID=A0ABU6YLI0_9FABA|nr:hypothetical protein [Stylosanthes scabra]
MKEKYQYAADMLACSGFGWNDDKQCVEVDSMEVLSAWMKAHPKKHYTPGKPFPMFQRLGRIFGKDRATGSAAVSGFDAEEQVGEEAEEEDTEMDEVFVSSTPTADVPSQSQGNAAQGTATSAEPSGTRRTLSGKKRKQADILERMADEVHESTAAQKEHVQILANAISGKNADVKMEKSFWGFTDAQLTTLAQDILDGNFNY